MKQLISFKFLLLFLSLTGYAQFDKQDTILKAAEIKTFEKSGNIYVVFPDGAERQLTFTQKDEKPNLMKSKNQIVFIRNEKVTKEETEYTRKKIMKVDINTYFEETITDKKPFKDGLDNTYEILRITNPSLSADDNFLYFITPHTSASSQLIKLDIRDGKWYELFSAETFELLSSEQFKNYFLVSCSEIRTNQRGIYYYLVDETGKKLKEFDSEASMMQFRNSFK